MLKEYFFLAMLTIIIAIPNLALSVRQIMKNEIVENPEGKVAAMSEAEFEAEYKSRMLKLCFSLIVIACSMFYLV